MCVRIDSNPLRFGHKTSCVVSDVRATGARRASGDPDYANGVAFEPGERRIRENMPVTSRVPGIEALSGLSDSTDSKVL